MNIDFKAEIYNEALIMIENFCLQIAKKIPSQLEMPSPNRSAAASFDVELHHEKNDNMINLPQSTPMNEINACPEILYFLAIRKDVRINYKYECTAAKDRLAGNWERKDAA
ncbi:unnamed protein product [Onchocerca ochengi]|uniref:Uncharacterized protein n=1 Tax=Onchocerca ochengi TaxID=42157 RepID=A0A182DXE7_ONCOC|nr:unnamed protein product [Onchocerca ochengi]